MNEGLLCGFSSSKAHPRVCVFLTSKCMTLTFAWVTSTMSSLPKIVHLKHDCKSQGGKGPQDEISPTESPFGARVYSE